MPGAENPDEPVFVYGDIPYTSPFFLNSSAEPFILLEDEAGFVQRDREFRFNLAAQTIGPVEMRPDETIGYSLTLPAIPQGTQVDVDQNSRSDPGVQVFALAFWSNTWGGPFLEPRDGKGWSTAYASTITDPENDDEIKGGTLLVWAPNNAQGFPTDFGPDRKLFTADDPTAPIPAGYNFVDLSVSPFRVWKEAQAKIDLFEGEVAVNDLSGLNYDEAFVALFNKAAREYPFTAEKQIDWDALYSEFVPRAAAARSDADFYRVLRDFTWAIPDGHVGVSFNPEVFYQEAGGGLGMLLTQLSTDQVVVTRVFPSLPAAEAGIEPGAEILKWNGQPIAAVLDTVTPYFGPYSTETTRRYNQPFFLTRMPVGTRVQLTFQNLGGPLQDASLTAAGEYDSIQALFPTEDELALPIEAEVLDASGLGYLRIRTFSDDYNLMARLWQHHLEALIDSQVPGLIIDLRQNGGGSTGLASDFVGFFFTEEIPLYQSYYYNENSGKFEVSGVPATIQPGPLHYDGQVALLVGPDCVSACEGFAYAMAQQERAIIVGHYPSAGAYGEVGRGQYKLPGDLTLQFPTGRSQTADGQLVLEGTGVTPSILVPVVS
jgi:C-terminal processing protease CtpA/Prc